MIPLRSLLLFKSLLLSSLMITVSASNKNRNGVNKYKVPFSIQKQRSAQEAAVPVTYPNGHPSCPCQPLDNIAPAVWEEMSPQARFELGGTNESLPVYGLGCGLHDVIINPYCHGSKRAEYCSRRFCYVNPNQCDLANRWSAYFEGRFFSYATCGDVDFFSADNRIHSLNGRSVRVALNHNSGGWQGAFSMRKQHFVSPLDEWTGPFVSLLKEAARVANFTIKVEKPLPELQERSTNYFQSSSPNDYCIYNVALGNLDMCVSQYAITDIRLTSVEFLVLKTLPLVLVVQLEETSLYEDGEQIFEPFELSTWLFIVFFVVPLFGGLFVCHELDKYGSAFPRHHAVLIKYDEENEVEALNGKRRPVERVIPLHNHIGRSIYDTFLAVLRLQYEKSVVTFGAHLHLIGLGFFILTITAAFTANLYSILNRKAITPKSYISFENAIERDYRFCTDRKIMQILVSHNPDLKDENFAIDPVDRRPGIMEAEDIVFRQLDPLLASENEEYCHAILTFRESLEAEQAFGRHCDKQIVTTDVAHINTGIPVSPIISDAIIPLFLQVTNTGFLSREFQRSAPVPKCQILDIPPPVRIGTFVSKRLTIRDLSGCFGVAFGFSGLALLVTFLHRKKKRLRRGEPEAIKITGMDQYGQVFSRLDEKGDLPFLRIHAVRDGDTILLKEDGADNNDLPDGRRERRSNTRSLPVQQRIRYKVGSFSTRMKQHIKAREASTRHQFGVSMSERMLSFATKTSKISLRPRRKSLVAMNETSDRRERDISKNSGVTIGDSMSSLSIPNIVEITDSSSEEAAHDRREHSKPVDHDDVRNKKRPQGQLKKPPPTENIFQDQIQGDQSPIPTHPQRRRDTFQRQESISPIPPASLNHKNSNVDNPFRRQTSIAPDNPFRQTATANPFRQRGLQPQLSTRSSAMSAHSANSRQSGQGASRASSEASLYEENDSIRHPILSSEAPSRPGSNRALVRATSSRPKQRRRIITPPPPQAKVQTKTSRKPTSTRKEELRPSKRLPALELPAESKKSSSHREKGRMLVLQASGGELAVTKTGSSSSPSPKEDVQFHMGSYVKETTQTTEQQNKSSKKKKKKKTERKESRPMTPTVSFTDDNLFLVDNDDMVESG